MYQQPNGEWLTDKQIIVELNLNIMWLRLNFIHSSYTLFLIGAYIGINYDASYLGGTPQDINIVAERPIKKLICRILLSLVIYYFPIYLPKKVEC